MSIPRRQIVDISVTRWYHCISRCVRGARVLGKRKDWIRARIEELAGVYAISVGGFSIMSNHFHLVLRIDEAVARGWSAEEVARRWAVLYPRRGPKREPLPPSAAWLKEKASDATWVETMRRRLCELGWLMKSLKEPLARMANREDGVRGHFFDARYKSIPVVDEEALLAVAAYVDLNPVAAKVARTPESSDHTSIKARLDHVKASGRMDDLAAAAGGSTAGSARSAGLEDGLWLCPVEDRRRQGSAREGMLEGFPLGAYVLLVEHTGRLFREGKASISSSLADVFTRLRTDADRWNGLLTRLRAGVPRRRWSSRPRPGEPSPFAT